MRNIYSILEKYDVEIPEDKKKSFEKEFEKNYKTISEVETIRENLKKANETIDSKDKDLEELNKKLTDAGTDSEKLKEVSAELSKIKKDYADEKKNLEEAIKQQQYEFAIKEKVSSLKFSSNAAKETFTKDAIKKGMQIENGDVLGFDDFVKSYKEKDAGCFSESNNDNKPKFGGSTGNDNQKGKPVLKSFY